MDEVTKWKLRWTLGLVSMGWVFMFFLPTEDGEPLSAFDWWLWVAVNVFALVKVHFWVSGPVRRRRRRVVR